MLRKYGRLHITSYHLYWHIQDLFAFGLSLSFKAFASPCPFLFLSCQSFIAFPPPRFPWGALIQSLPSRACGPCNRSWTLWTLYGCRLPWRIDVPFCTFLCCSVSPADLRIWEWVAVVRVRKSNPVSCPQNSQASQNKLDMCERQIPVVSLTEKLQFQLLRHSKEFVRDSIHEFHNLSTSSCRKPGCRLGPTRLAVPAVKVGARNLSHVEGFREVKMHTSQNPFN